MNGCNIKVQVRVRETLAQKSRNRPVYLELTMERPRTSAAKTKLSMTRSRNLCILLSVRTIRRNKSSASGLESAGKYESRSLGLAFALDMMAFRAAGCVTNDSCSSGGRPSTDTIVSNWWCGLWPWQGG